MNKYKEGEVIKVKITAVEKYGAFALIDEEYSGLIHISEITEKFVRDITDFVEVGDVVNAKIILIPNEHNQLRLSIKGLNEDLQKSKRRRSRTVYLYVFRHCIRRERSHRQK